jgi:hypothetical protein
MTLYVMHTAASVLLLLLPCVVYRVVRNLNNVSYRGLIAVESHDCPSPAKPPVLLLSAMQQKITSCWFDKQEFVRLLVI